MTQHYDSAGRAIYIGNKIKFRGEIFTLADFGPNEDHYNVATLIFEEPIEHTPEVPHESNVDLVG